MSVDTGYMLLTFFIVLMVLIMAGLVGSMVWMTRKDRHR
jgi:flagellar basal body-associated protein FliL